jgi:ABC-2 type transport system ATP-binding protein
MCDQIAIINHGEIIAQDTTAALLSRLDRKEAHITVDRDIQEIPIGLSGPGVDTALKNSREILIHFAPSRVQIGALLDSIRSAGLQVSDLSTRDTDLEEIFVALTSEHPDGLRSPSDGDPQAGPLESSRTRPAP